MPEAATQQELKPTAPKAADKKPSDSDQAWKALYPKWTTVKLPPVKPEFSLRVGGEFYLASLAVGASHETGKSGKEAVEEFAAQALKEFLANPASRKPVTPEEREAAQVGIPSGAGGKVVSVTLGKDDITPADLAKRLMARYGAGEDARPLLLREALAIKLKAAYAKHAGQ
jgi:hypothetical protein